MMQSHQRFELVLLILPSETKDYETEGRRDVIYRNCRVVHQSPRDAEDANAGKRLHNTDILACIQYIM